MTKIYAAAQNTLVWLGEAEDGDDTLEKWQEEDDLLGIKPPIFDTNVVLSYNPEITTKRYLAVTKPTNGEMLYFDDLEAALTHWAEDPRFKLGEKEYKEETKLVMTKIASPKLHTHSLLEQDLSRLSQLFLRRR